MNNCLKGTLVIVTLMNANNQASQKPQKVQKPPYQYSIVHQQQCPYCNKVTRFIPCTPCAVKVLSKALEKFGQFFDPIQASVSDCTTDCLGQLLSNSSETRRLDVQAVLCSSSVADIVRYEKFGHNSKFSIKFDDRAALMAALNAKKMQNKTDEEAISEDIPLKTVLLTPRPVKKDAIVPLKKASSQGCASSCIIL